MTDITPFQFFETIFHQPLGHGQLMVWSKIRRSGKTMTDWCFSLPQAARRIESYRKRREILFGVALHDRQKALARARQRNYRAKPTQVRAGEESVTALPALWAELGVASSAPWGAGGDKYSAPWGAGGDKYSAPWGAGGDNISAPRGAGGDNHGDRPAALAWIETLSPPPSILVWTGAAYQVYWLLAEPWVLENEEDRRRAKRLLDKVQWALAGATAAESWYRGGDLAGLMQVAGTFHHVGGERLPVVVERHPRAGAGGRWAASDFEDLDDPPPRPRGCPWPEAAGADLPGSTAEGTGRQPPQGNRKGDLQRPPECGGGEFQRLWRGCSWLRHCYDHQATLPESEWKAALSVVGRCQAGPAAGGAILARSFSQRHPGYLPHLTAQALERILGGKAGAATCRHIGRELEAWDRHCSRCPHQGQIDSPIVLGQRPPGGRGGDLRAEKKVTRPVANATPTAAAAAPSQGAPRPQPPAGGVEIEVIFRFSPGAIPTADGWPLLQPPLAALACLEGDPGAELAAGEPAAEPTDPTAGPGREHPRSLGGVPRLFLDGLEELLAGGGGQATVRRMVETLAAEENRQRFERLRSALRQLFPGAVGGLPTPRQLGYVLRSYRRQGAGERTVVVAGRGTRGREWAVRKTRDLASEAGVMVPVAPSKKGEKR